MDPAEIYNLLQQACIGLESLGEFGIAAHVGHCMALTTARFGVGRDHLDDD